MGIGAIVSRVRRRLGEQRGFTLIEMLTSATILAGSLLALEATIAAGRGLTTSSETQSVAAKIAEREMEGVLAAPYSRIALTTCSTDSAYRANCSPSPGTFSPDGNSSESLVVDAAGAVAPVTTGQAAGRFKVNIYRYVSWAPSDPGLATVGMNDPNGHDYKRVTISVRVLGQGALKGLVTTSSIAVDPCAGPGRAAVCTP